MSESQGPATPATPAAPSTPDGSDDPMAGLPEVTQQDVESAMGVNSVPDQVRTTSDSADETEQVIDSTGQLTGPADEGGVDEGVAAHPDLPRTSGD